MPDPFTLEHLRTFVAVHEAGNFTAAARRLRRVQSAVSATMANLEEQLGVSLWDRSTRIPTLTDHGRVMLAAAKRVLVEADTLKRVAADFVEGVEPKVSLCVDALFPVPALVDMAVGFARKFPAVDLRVDTETMSAVSERVLDGSATVGVVSPPGVRASARASLERRALAPIRMVTVTSPAHPLAMRKGPIETHELAQFVQVVLSERHPGSVPDQAVLSDRTWRITDLHTKRAMLLGGVGWGNLPEHSVSDDLARGVLVAIQPAAWGKDEHTLHLSAIYRRETTMGPAHRWLLTELEMLCQREGRFDDLT